MSHLTKIPRHRIAISIEQARIVLELIAPIASSSEVIADLRIKLIKLVALDDAGLSQPAYIALPKVGSMASITGGKEYTPEELAEYEAQFMASLATGQ